jgi:hypothetical protein
MIKKIILSLFTFMVITAQSQTIPAIVPNIDWKTYYSFTDTIENVSSAMDGNNTVYSTGYVFSSPTNIDLIVQARDSLGTLLWTTLYDNGGIDKGKAIEITSGGIFVTGVSDGLGKDYVTIKLNASTGGTVWATRMNNFGSFNDEPNDIAVDVSGNSYVTGYGSASGGGNSDAVTVKYNSSGVQQWKNTYAGTLTASNDLGASIVLSSNGNTVFITGTSNQASGNSKMVTRAINASAGTSNWTTLSNGTTSGNSVGNKIVLSGANVVVCGQFANTTTGLDHVTIKYSGNTGTAMWTKCYDSGNYTNTATDLVINPAGNISVTGYLYNGTTYSYHTVQYDSTGTQLNVNIENLGLNSITVNPHIGCDTIIGAFYVCGEAQRLTRDIFAYQILNGSTKWKEYVDGQSFDLDAATSLVVNSIGVVYLSALSRMTTAHYDICTIKISQTPVEFPPDIVSNEKPMVNHLYYENKGQVIYNSTTVANDILFSTMDFYYPSTFVSANRISYKLAKHDTVNNGTDTVQRIDISMFGSNPLAVAYPYEPQQGSISYMQQGMPDAVTGIQGYQRYFIPNIYPSIDLHYYSNQNGIKLYYVLKPFANPNNIQWEITGANSTTLSTAGLEIRGFNHTIVFDQPTVYTINNSGTAIPLTSTVAPSWTHSGSYGISVPSYSTSWPLIIELDYGNSITTTSSTDNMQLCTYYGGSQDDGFTDMDVNSSTGDFVTLGATQSVANGVQFPTVPGTNVSISTNTVAQNSYFTVVVFDKDGIRKAANTYGVQGGQITPLKAVLNGSKITVVGNCHATGALPVYFSTSQIAANSYTTNTNGEGFVMQFQTVSSNGLLNINGITWTGRLNGFASDIDKTPDGKNIYITSSTNYGPIDTKTVSGAYNWGLLVGLFYGDLTFQVSKFDSTGIRLWATLFPVANSLGATYNHNGFGNGSQVLNSDIRLKCRIACDNYGFYLAGESNTVFSPFGTGYSKYGAPHYPAAGSSKDAFFARFSKKDSIVYMSFFGGVSGDDVYNDVKIINPNEVIAVGYSNSWDNYQSNLLTAPNVGKYVDTSMVHAGIPNTAPTKMLISRFDSIGNKTWSTFWGNNTTGDCIGWSVKGDNVGRVFITGKDSGSFVFPQTNPSGVYNQTSINKTESFMLCFDNTDNPVWNTRLGGASDDIGLDVEYNPVSDRMVLVGITNTRESVVSPPFPIRKDASLPANAWYQSQLNYGNAFSYDGYIAFFKTEMIVGIKEYFKDNTTTDAFNLFPNPAQTGCSLAFKQALHGKVQIEVYNQMGQLVLMDEQNDVLPYSVLPLKISSLINGIYIVNVHNGNNTYSKKLIINK